MGGEGGADLSPYPTGVAARLSAHCSFSFGRPGFLGNFSADGTGRRRWVTTDGGIVRHRRHWEGSAGESKQGLRGEIIREEEEETGNGGGEGGGVGRIDDERKVGALYVFPTERVRRGKEN